MVDQVKKIRPLDRVSSCQHKDWYLQGRNLIYEMFAFISAKFKWISIRLGGSAAMHTREVASLGHFPDGDEWTFVEVDGVDLRIHRFIRQLAPA